MPTTRFNELEENFSNLPSKDTLYIENIRQDESLADLLEKPALKKVKTLHITGTYFSSKSETLKLVSAISNLVNLEKIKIKDCSFSSETSEIFCFNSNTLQELSIDSIHADDLSSILNNNESNLSHLKRIKIKGINSTPSLIKALGYLIFDLESLRFFAIKACSDNSDFEGLFDFYKERKTPIQFTFDDSASDRVKELFSKKTSILLSQSTSNAQLSSTNNSLSPPFNKFRSKFSAQENRKCAELALESLPREIQEYLENAFSQIYKAG